MQCCSADQQLVVELGRAAGWKILLHYNADYMGGLQQWTTWVASNNLLQCISAEVEPRTAPGWKIPDPVALLTILASCCSVILNYSALQCITVHYSCYSALHLLQCIALHLRNWFLSGSLGWKILLHCSGD